MENQQKNSAPENNSDNRNSNNNKKKPSKTVVIWIVSILLTFMIWQGITAIQQSKQEKITYDTFLQMLDDKLVTDVKLYNDRISFTPISKETGAEMDKTYYVIRISDYKIVDRLQKAGVQFEEMDEGKNAVVSTILSYVVMIGAFYLLMSLLMRNMSKSGGIGKSNAKMYVEKKTGVTFADVAGQEEAKESLCEMVDFLDQPDRYLKIGAKLPKGALLVGPPGTGKTLMAKAMAGEANVPFFSMSGSDFVEMFVGVGASRVRDLFKQAKEKAPCIIFIDEIDAIGRARGKTPNMGANDERENTLNQLLTEMDGFETNSGVIILAATNRADILDSALLRAGRFDRQIYVDLPELKDREEIFKVHLKPLKLAEDIDYAFLAKQTPGFSGADIANVANEAALIAARKNKLAVEKQDFLDSIDRIVGGLENRSKVIKPSEKKAIAYHEAGHATVSWLLQHAHPLLKVTIVPRGKALGAAWYLPQERQITTKDQLLDQMCSVLGGRAAEEIVFGEISTGAQNDLERATKQAYAMVSIYGMSDKVGMLSYYDSTGQSDFSFTKPYSEKTAELIDAEVKDMVTAAYERAKQLLNDHREQHRQVAELLIEREVIFSDDLENILGKRPWTEEEETQQPEEL